MILVHFVDTTARRVFCSLLHNFMMTRLPAHVTISIRPPASRPDACAHSDPGSNELSDQP